MTFSEKLITLRAGRSWSQERLAEELGVTRQAVGRWEKGAGLPDAMSLTRLALVFDVAPEWLLDEAAPDEPQPRRQGRARAEWFDYLAFALVLLILVLNYALSAKIAERFKYYGYTPLMVFWLVALRPLGWLAAGWAVSALAICAGRMPPPAKRVRLVCAVLGALPPADLRSLRRALLRRRQGPRASLYPAVSLSLRPRRLRPPARPCRKAARKTLSGVVHFKVYSLKSQ